MVRLTDRGAALVRGGRVVVSDEASGRLVRRLLDRGLVDPVATELPQREPPRELTVIVPVYNSTYSLRRLLDTRGADPVFHAARVLVVDDGSPEPDQISGVCREHGVEYVRLPTNRGPAVARNVGLQMVATPLVAFVDADVEFDRPVLGLLGRHFTDPALAAIAPRVLASRPGASGSWIERYEATSSSLDRGSAPANVRPGSPVAWVPSAVLVARVVALGSGYDETMRSGEDVDLVWRCVAAGWTVRYEPATSVRHHHRRRLGELLARKAFYGSSAAPLAKRHGRAVAPARFSRGHIALLGLALARGRWRIPVAAGMGAMWTGRLTRTLGGSADSAELARALVATGTLNAIGQCGTLVLRHWWPVGLILSLASPRFRRVLGAWALIDSIAGYRRNRPHLDLVRYAALRRLDDLAYGAGVWRGAVRYRSLGCLVPVLTPRSLRTASGVVPAQAPRRAPRAAS